MPTVTATGLATVVISDGDDVEVDGTTGRVTVLKSRHRTGEAERVPDAITGPDAIAWVDDIAPERAIGVCGAKMGRLAELFWAGVNLPKGFTVTVTAFRRHWEQAGLAEFADAALDGLAPAPSPPGSRRPRLPSAPR